MFSRVDSLSQKKEELPIRGINCPCICKMTWHVRRETTSHSDSMPSTRVLNSSTNVSDFPAEFPSIDKEPELDSSKIMYRLFRLIRRV